MSLQLKFTLRLLAILLVSFALVTAIVAVMARGALRDDAFRQLSDTADSQAKARKDLRQASALLEVLLEDRMYELQEVWNEALSRGPSWQKKLLRGAGGLPSPVKEGLLRLTEVRVMDPFKNQGKPDLSGDPDKTR